jgi:hypothetical protein
VSTRRLIATALLCGLAILVAGGVWLFLTARSSDDTSAAISGQVGRPVLLGPLSLTAQGAEVGADGSVALAVEMAAVTGDVPHPAQGWAVFSNRNVARLDRVPPPADAADACTEADLSKGQTVSCRLFFHGTSEQVRAGLLAIYGLGSSRAVWPLPA